MTEKEKKLQGLLSHPYVQKKIEETVEIIKQSHCPMDFLGTEISRRCITKHDRDICKECWDNALNS